MDNDSKRRVNGNVLAASENLKTASNGGAVSVLDYVTRHEDIRAVNFLISAVDPTPYRLAAWRKYHRHTESEAVWTPETVLKICRRKMFCP